MREVAVIGIGMTKWGECWQKSLRDLFVEASLRAMDDAGLSQIESLYVGCMSGGLFNGQEHVGPLMADYLGAGPIPAVRVESACASGGVAFRQAYMEVASGMSDIVLAGGVEKMTDVDGSEATYALGTAADQEYESFHGITFPGLYALIAKVYMKKYGITNQDLASVAVKNHAHGVKNPNAQFQRAITVEEVLQSSMVADPLHLLDCSPITDGAAAVILCPMEKAKSLSKKKPVKILGSGHATDSIALHDRKQLEVFASATIAAKKAFSQAKIGIESVNLVEVHDCFSIAEICALESMGFFAPGQAGKAASQGLTALGGKLPVNVSGGLKSKGHPVGATGIAQIIELVEQLRGEAGQRQVANARIGLAQNMGGTAASSVVHILEAC
ncbi:MAG: thiolase domain-containing protein [Candidatus Brocadiae bacterium]|nr:thiolase domain-containing protein [Candidatus Brocadiia bacterium]